MKKPTKSNPYRLVSSDIIELCHRTNSINSVVNYNVKQCSLHIQAMASSLKAINIGTSVEQTTLTKKAIVREFTNRIKAQIMKELRL